MTETKGLIFKLSQDNEILFDDYEVDDGDPWAYLCESCKQKYNVPDKYLDDSPAESPKCSVYGCYNQNVYYIDMPNDMCQRVKITDIFELPSTEQFKEFMKFIEFAYDNAHTGMGWKCEDTFEDGYVCALNDVLSMLGLNIGGDLDVDVK